MFMGKKDKRGKDFKHPGRTRRRRGWRQAGPVGGRRRTSWRFPYIYINLQIYHWICLQSSRSAWGNIVYGHTAYATRHFQFPRRRSPVAVAATPRARPCSLFLFCLRGCDRLLLASGLIRQAQLALSFRHPRTPFRYFPCSFTGQEHACTFFIREW